MTLITRIKAILAVITFVVSANSLAGSTAYDWAQVTTPNQAEQSQSIGGYANGCISGAASLPLEGTGYQVMRLSRKRYYGHTDLIQFIQNLGQFAATEQVGTLLVGDLGQPRGGPTLSGHRSHQTGLDVDIWFLLSKQASERILSKNERESWSAPSVVDIANDTVDYEKWTEAHEKVLEAAARMPEVDRIFVNPSIKLELCNHKGKNSREWLRKIRPWWKHDDHFHVRLKCPDNNPDCKKQEPLPAGDGCDEGLMWWFTEEAKHPKKTEKTPSPPLPDLCEQLLVE